MGIPLPVEARLDERSATAAADRAQRVFANAGKDAGKTFSDSFTNGARDADAAMQKMGDRAKDAYDKATDAAGKLRSEEARLQELREKQASNSQIVSAAERVEKARRAEVRAIRDATNAMQEYEQASESAGRNSGNSFLGGLRGAAGGAAATGQDMAGEFAAGFAGASALTKLASFAIPGAGWVAAGVAAGKLLASGISDGLASLYVKDLFQARLAVDDATMAQLGAGAAQAYAGGYGETLEANLGAMQFGIQGRLVGPDAGAGEIQQLIEKTQTLSSIMGEDPQAIVRGTRGFIDSGLVSSYQEAFDLIAAAQSKGLNLTDDLLDSAEEYGTSFRELGLNGAEAFGLINQVVESGARNSDQAADGLKEVAINLQDGSKLTAEALSALGFDAQDMTTRLADGGSRAREAFGLVLAEIQKVQDPVQRDRIGLALFKTKWEDMGKAIDGADLSTAASELGAIDGSLNKANDTLSKNVNQWDLLGREIDVAFGKLNEWLATTDIGKLYNQIPTLLMPSKDFLAPPMDFPAPDPSKLNPLLLPGIDPATVVPPPGAPGSPLPAAGPNPLAPFLDSLPGAVPGGADGGPARVTPVPMTPESADAGEKPKTVIDPSRFSLDSVPIGSMPGVGQAQAPGTLPMPGVAQPQGVPTWDPTQQAYGSMVVDPQKVWDAETSLISQRQSVESARERLLVMEAEGTATMAELNAARTSVITSERAYISGQQKLLEAQQGTWKKANDALSGAMGDLKSVFAPLDEDFGISGGIPGIVENLTRMFGNMALAGAIGSSPLLQGAALELAANKGGAGLFGFGNATPPAMVPSVQAGTPAAPHGAPTEAQVKQIAAAFGLQVTSEDRPGDPGYHGQGMALDVSNGSGNTQQQRGFAEYMAQNFGSSLKELIYSDGTFSNLIGDGKNVTGTGYYSPETLAEHQNHVHVAADWGKGGGGAFAGASNGSPVPVSVVNGPGSASGFNWDAVAAKESSGNWQNQDTGNNGHFGGLQFDPRTWASFGGIDLTGQSNPANATREQQIEIANRTAFTGYNGTPPQGLGAWEVITNGSTAADGITVNSRPPSPPGALPPIPVGSGGGQGYMGLGGPVSSAPGGVAPQTSGGGTGGIGVDGMAMDAIMASTSALDVMAPGAGQAAKVGIQLANRAIKFGSQAAAIGASGLMETFLPSGSPLGNFGNSWIGKIAGGVASMKPATANMAGQQSAPPNPNAQQGQQAAGTKIGTNIEKVEYNNNEATQGNGINDFARNMEATNAPSGGVR